MRFTICYEINGSEDSFVVEGDSIEEIQNTVKYQLEQRGISMSDAWSEGLS